MRIVHVVEPFASGVATFVKQIVESLPLDYHILIHGERPEVMSVLEVKQSFPKSKIRFIHWKSAARELSIIKDIRAALELYHILKRLKPEIDAVHLHSSKSGFLGRIICRMLGLKNVIYTPNGAPFLMKEGVLRRNLYKLLELTANKFGGKVVCVSASEMEAYKKIGINAYFINNGTNLKIPELSYIHTGQEPKKFRVAFTGRVLKQKNPHLFNEIASQFSSNKEIEFVWIGDGEEKHLLSSPNIRITGWLAENDVKKEIERADVYLSTAEYEGLSFGVLEAMAIGKPLILSNCTGNKDTVKFGLNGDLFNNAEQACTYIQYYFYNREMLKAMGDYSRKFCAQEFNADANAKTYRMAYTL